MKAEKEKGKKKKNKDKKDGEEDTFKPDLHDPRFEAIYHSSQFALDPSDPKFASHLPSDSFSSPSKVWN